MINSKFIVIEGLEGAGKTTALQHLLSLLKQHHIKKITTTREPGGTPLAEAMRCMVKAVPEVQKNGVTEHVTDTTELLLMYAARSQLVENVIKPALAEGFWVIGDRHDLSSQAYQGGGRQLDIAFLSCLRQYVLADFKPDLTLYLDIDPKQGLQRAQQRGSLDRIEQLELDFFERTRARYLELATEDRTIKTINAGVSLHEVLQQITDVINRVMAQWALEEK